MADEVAAAPLEQEKWADAWNADGMLYRHEGYAMRGPYDRTPLVAPGTAPTC